jgi:ketosteroid isomerase-like protein
MDRVFMRIEQNVLFSPAAAATVKAVIFAGCLLAPIAAAEQASDPPTAVQTNSVHADQNAAAETEIKALETDLAKLVVSADRDGYAKHLAADYLNVREDGVTETREDVLHQFSDAKHKIIFMEPDTAKMTIHVYGDTAIASAEFSLTGRELGQVRQHTRLLTHVFLKRGGEWVLIAGQATTVR